MPSQISTDLLTSVIPFQKPQGKAYPSELPRSTTQLPTHWVNILLSSLTKGDKKLNIKNDHRSQVIISPHQLVILGGYLTPHTCRVNKLMTNNLLFNSQNKLDLDETFTEASRWMFLKIKPNNANSNYSKPNQL